MKPTRVELIEYTKWLYPSIGEKENREGEIEQLVDMYLDLPSKTPSSGYMCVVCGQVPVDALNGFDTCDACAGLI